MRSASFAFMTAMAAAFTAGTLPLTAAEPTSRPTTTQTIHPEPSWVIHTPQVDRIAFTPGQINLTAPSGQTVTVPVQHEYLKTGSLAR